MYSKDSSGIKLILFVFSICLFLFLGTINIYQPSSLNSDGSGSINIQYYTNDSNLVNSQVIGNYPFTEGEAQTYFTSANTEVKNINIYRSTENLTTYMVLDIDFKDINKISETKGYSGFNASWIKTDSGMLFKWVILKNQLQNNSIGDLVYKFKFDGKVTSSNGISNADSVIWVINPKTYDYTNDIALTALVEADNKSSCGQIGMELPLMLMGSIVFLCREKNKRISY